METPEEQQNRRKRQEMIDRINQLKLSKWTRMENEKRNSYFRRNYHASSLLLPDGTILTAGGDVWNAEIFYPPYLFTKDWNDKTVLAKRPQILDVDSSFKRGEKKNIHILEENISKVTLISTGSTTHAQGSESKYRSLNFHEIFVKIKIRQREI